MTLTTKVLAQNSSNFKIETTVLPKVKNLKLINLQQNLTTITMTTRSILQKLLKTCQKEHSRNLYTMVTGAISPQTTIDIIIRTTEAASKSGAKIEEVLGVNRQGGRITVTITEMAISITSGVRMVEATTTVAAIITAITMATTMEEAITTTTNSTSSTTTINNIRGTMVKTTMQTGIDSIVTSTISSRAKIDLSRLIRRRS